VDGGVATPAGSHTKDEIDEYIETRNFEDVLLEK
jgi:hypothetical protein